MREDEGCHKWFYNKKKRKENNTKGGAETVMVDVKRSDHSEKRRVDDLILPGQESSLIIIFTLLSDNSMASLDSHRYAIDDLSRTLSIIYATETGNAQEYAGRIAHHCRRAHFRCRVFDVDKYPVVRE